MATKTPAPATEGATGLARLREPFAENEQGTLPKAVSRDDREKHQCRPGTKASADGVYCGGYHVRSIHLTYVGHAAITKRLLEVDPEWTYRPLGVDEYGLPKFDSNGGLWIELTVLGHSKIGYGDSQGKTGPNAVKEAIGDALRNAGMRFGMALELWHKGDLYANEVEQGKIDPEAEEAPRAGGPQPVTKDVNWLEEANKKGTADEVLEVWRNAKRGGAKPEVLKAIEDLGVKLREAEEAEAIDPTSDPVLSEEQAAQQMKEGFGG